jgi:hypothetical protein
VVWRNDFTGRLVELSEPQDLYSELAVLRGDLFAVRRELNETLMRTAELVRVQPLRTGVLFHSEVDLTITPLADRR